jgi:hypothetical protein
LSFFTRFRRPSTQDHPTQDHLTQEHPTQDQTMAPDDLTTDGRPKPTPDNDTTGEAASEAASEVTGDEPVAAGEATGDEPATAGEATGDGAGDQGDGDQGDGDQGDGDQGDGAGDEPAEGRDARRVKHPVVAGVITTLAGLFVLLALNAPNKLGLVTPRAFVRIPLEGLAGVALLLVLPAKSRRVLAALGGAVLGLLTIKKMLDMGFFEVLGRPFDPVYDSTLIKDAAQYVRSTSGRPAEIGAAVAAVVLAIAVLGLMALSAMRLASAVARHKPATTRAVTASAAVWIACSLLGAQIIPGVPVAANNTTIVAYNTALRVRASLRDREVFAKEAATDAFHNTPDDQLLTALRGKDVIFTFVESYGRSALENPELSPQITAALDAGTRGLAAAGYSARSAFLTSPTYGGGSWLAHSTLLSGVWIDNQQRYQSLISGNRLTLTRAFHSAGWRTVGVEPGVTATWPEGYFYGYDRVYDSRNLGYQGPHFGWSTMPDQYTLEQFEKSEYSKPNRGPLLGEITLTSSHWPWAPVPRMIGWNDLGDGSVFGPIAKEGDSRSTVWKDSHKVRAGYSRSIAYSIDSLVSFVENYANKNTVLVFLGDHQASTIITGENASHDVPVTIVANDPAVLNRISGWGWQDGLKPSPQAPLWRMDAFRDKFLTAFGPPTPTG